MSNKRFTDTKKWRNSWFRSLPSNAKLTWIYLCDECESHGVLKIDYDLAIFQLGFKINPQILSSWFQDRIHFIDQEKILIVDFFEFQYGDSKDTWSAKIHAKKKLEAIGFIIENNKISINLKEKDTTVTPQWGYSPSTVLIKGIVKGKVLFNKEIREKIEKIYIDEYPLKKGKTKGVDKLSKEIITEEDLENFKVALNRYKGSIGDPKFIKHFSTFASEWRDWLDPGAGQTEANKQSMDVSHIWDEK